MSNPDPQKSKRLNLQTSEGADADEHIDPSIASSLYHLEQIVSQQEKLLKEVNATNERLKSLDSIAKFLKTKTSTPTSSESVITVILMNENNTRKLTPYHLVTKISPYLDAISDIQVIINELLGRESTEVQIREIKQNSPISISLDGAAEALQVVQEAVIPWRRKHAEKMIYLLEQEKLADIETKKAEILEKRADAAKSRVEIEKLRAEVSKQNQEAKRMELENEKLRLELHREKIQLALDILNLMAPNLSETERISYLVKLLPPLDIVIYSEFEIDKSEKTG